MAGPKLTDRQRRMRYAGRKLATIFVVVVVLVLLVVADRLGVFGRRNRADREKYHGQSFRIVKVIDGDTLDLDVPDGRFPHTRVRLWGVDTPETHKPDTPVQHFGPESRRFTRDSCLGKQIRLELEPHRGTRGRYGRLLAWVYLPDGRLLNRVLIEKGFAYADPRYEHHLLREFRQLQIESMEARRGLWEDIHQRDLPYYYRELRLP
jgi:endonuclease YncB( thermonuclease family)